MLRGVGLSLVLAGCSAAYNGERLFWKAQRLRAPLLKDPSRATPEQFAAAIAAFETVIRRTPETRWAARAQLAIGSLYAAQRQWDEARVAYALVVQNHHKWTPECLKARTATARLYEAEGRWEEAVGMYREIADFHTWSSLGLEVPLYIARGYEQRGRSREATDAYRRAVDEYTRWIAQAPSAQLGTQVKEHLALAHQRLGQWERALEVLTELASRETGVNRPLVLLTLGTIYETKMDDREKAQATFAKLLEEFPTHPFGELARAHLERLGAPAGSPNVTVTSR
jgi:tetratricopeptide (TPR) repeat protein